MCACYTQLKKIKINESLKHIKGGGRLYQPLQN